MVPIVAVVLASHFEKTCCGADIAAYRGCRQYSPRQSWCIPIFDNQIFKVEAFDAQARFAVSLKSDKIHSALGLILGQLRVALSGISRPSAAKLEELSVDEIAERAANSRGGGAILKAPRLVAGMETWQVPGTRPIDYIFRSTFEGKVDVGWNYSRISFIRDMWETRSRAFASRLGKRLPPSAVRITGGPGSSSAEGSSFGPEQQEKITAVVNVPTIQVHLHGPWAARHRDATAARHGRSNTATGVDWVAA
ncbi:hypothetical protein N7499_004576 [Penicillium canescens]|nr:hypothetical protein N7499_004576 [Penicillium canescens]